MHKRARVSFGQSSLFRCLAVPAGYAGIGPPLKTKRGPRRGGGGGVRWGREAASRSFRHVKGRKTRRNETLPNAVFSLGENIQPPQHTAQLCPLSSLIHRVISFPLQPIFFFFLSLSIPNLFPGGFRFRVINDESRDRRRNKKKKREREREREGGRVGKRSSSMKRLRRIGRVGG